MGFEDLFKTYTLDIIENANLVRDLIHKTIREIDEEVDPGARIVGYSLGRGYKNTICTLIPSKSNLKLGFYKGSLLNDPEGCLIGTGKVHRYVVIKDFYAQQNYLKYLLREAFKLWQMGG